MSDYIAELRRELVGAAERERRRRAPRRALRRARRPLALGLAGAAALAALVLGIVRELPTPAPAGPRVVATIRLGGIPVGAATGAGRVWVSDDTRQRARDRPQVPAPHRHDRHRERGRRASRPPTMPSGWSLRATMREEDYRLLRIDPASHRVVARHRLLRPVRRVACGHAPCRLGADGQAGSRAGPPGRSCDQPDRRRLRTARPGRDGRPRRAALDAVRWTASSSGATRAPGGARRARRVRAESPRRGVAQRHRARRRRCVGSQRGGRRP